MEKLYTTEEVCENFRVSKVMLYEYIRKGLLDYIKIGSKYRFTQKHLDDFVVKKEK